MNENSAAALYYGLERNDEKVHRVIFYNIGQSGLKVSLVEYHRTENDKKKKIEQIKVLSESYTDKISGKLLD